ncbi:MAG: hypothetical protein ABI352_02815 [Candidatus Dormibacter sp.]
MELEEPTATQDVCDVHATERSSPDVASVDLCVRDHDEPSHDSTNAC